jgi:DNA-binding LacI/PurR family transcriptional regulator
MVTINEVAHRAGVSTATVSRVINQSGFVSEELSIKVINAIKELNFYPNEIAKSLSTGSTNTIGLILPDISNPFFASIAKGVENFIWQKGFSLLLCDSNEDRIKQDIYINTLISKKINGLLIVPTMGIHESCKKLLLSSIHCVFVDRYPKGINVDYIGSDNISGAYHAVTYLLSKGHKNIAIFLADSNISSSRERFDGYKQALLNANLIINNSYVIWGCVDSEKSYNRFLNVIRDFPEISAIFCTTNPATIGILKAMKDLDLSYPEDISIVGFDELPLSDFLDKPITTISQDSYKLGMKSAEILVKRILGNHLPPIIREILEYKFIEGLSVLPKQ